MSQGRMVAVVVLALSLVLAACGGSSEEAPAEPATTGQAGSEATTSTEPTVDTSAVEPAVAEDPPAEDAPAPAGDSIDLVEHLRQKTMDLWEVYNTHDPDALKVFYSEAYWQEQEEEIRSNMQPFKLFGITITAEETSPPAEIEPGKWETRHTATFTLGSLNMVFIYEKFDGEWLLTYAEDQ